MNIAHPQRERGVIIFPLPVGMFCIFRPVHTTRVSTRLLPWRGEKVSRPDVNDRRRRGVGCGCCCTAKAVTLLPTQLIQFDPD